MPTWHVLLQAAVPRFGWKTPFLAVPAGLSRVLAMALSLRASSAASEGKEAGAVSWTFPPYLVYPCFFRPRGCALEDPGVSSAREAAPVPWFWFFMAESSRDVLFRPALQELQESSTHSSGFTLHFLMGSGVCRTLVAQGGPRISQWPRK